MRICGHLSPSCLAAEQVVESGQPVLWDCGTPCPVRPLYGVGTLLAGNSPLDTGSLAKSLLWGIRLVGHRLQCTAAQQVQARWASGIRGQVLGPRTVYLAWVREL